MDPCLQTNHIMLLSWDCDVTIKKAKQDGPKAYPQSIFYSEMEMHGLCTSYCCDLLCQNILFLSTVLKELAKGTTEKHLVSMAWKSVWHHMKSPLRRWQLNDSTSGRDRDWSVCSMQCRTEMKLLALNKVTWSLSATCLWQHQDPQLKNEVCLSPSQLKGCFYHQTKII